MRIFLSPLGERAGPWPFYAVQKVFFKTCVGVTARRWPRPSRGGEITAKVSKAGNSVARLTHFRGLSLFPAGRGGIRGQTFPDTYLGVVASQPAEKNRKFDAG